jgi:hypothetical protein
MLNAQQSNAIAHLHIDIDIDIDIDIGKLNWVDLIGNWFRMYIHPFVVSLGRAIGGPDGDCQRLKDSETWIRNGPARKIRVKTWMPS